jgi:hypothetical protein
MVYAQAPDTVWTRAYGAEHHEMGECIQSTTDGNFVIAGSNHSNIRGAADIYLVKIDPAGDTLWTQRYGTYDTEMGFSVVEKDDEGFFVIGNLYHYIGYVSRDVIFIQTDRYGNEIQTSYIIGSEDDFVQQIKKLSNGDYLVVGGTDSFGAGDYDLWLLYLDSTGDTVWTKTIGGANREWGFAVDVTPDGDYVIAGGKNNYETFGEDMFLVKTNNVGDIIWTRTFAGNESTDRAYDVKATSEGGCIAAGFAMTPSFPSRYAFIVKTDANGDTLWTKKIDAEYEAQAKSILIDQDGNYIIAGYREFYDPNHIDVYIICLNPNGDIVWTQSVNRGSWTEASSILETPNGDFIVTGYTKNYYNDDWETDLFIAKLSTEITGINDNTNTRLPEQVSPISNYPNPFNASTTIEYGLPDAGRVRIDVYDLLGRKVETLVEKEKQAGQHNAVWDALDHSSGVYFYRTEAGDFTKTSVSFP